MHDLTHSMEINDSALRRFVDGRGRHPSELSAEPVETAVSQSTRTTPTSAGGDLLVDIGTLKVRIAGLDSRTPAEAAVQPELLGAMGWPPRSWMRPRTSPRSGPRPAASNNSIS